MNETPLSAFMTGNPPDVVFYHKKCHDGIMSALIHSRHYTKWSEGPPKPIKYVQMHAGASVQELIDASGLGPNMRAVVHFLDLSIADPTGWSQALGGDQMHTTIVLDHHQDSFDAAPGSLLRTWGTQPQPGTNMYFDLSHAGCVLTAMALNEPVSEIALYVEDRDLWAWQYPEESEYVYMLLLALTPTLEGWMGMPDKLHEFPPQDRLRAEHDLALKRKFMDDWRLNHPPRIDILNGKHEVQFFTAPPKFHSEIGNVYATLNDRPAAMIYPIAIREGVPKVSLSIRTVKQSTMPAIELRRSMPEIVGGGHWHAVNMRFEQHQLPPWVWELASSLNEADYDKRN